MPMRDSLRSPVALTYLLPLLLLVQWHPAVAGGQRIVDDPARWLDYEIHYADIFVHLKVPPNHRFKEALRTQDLPKEARRPVKQIFSAQYDYGWRAAWNPSRFEVLFTIVVLDTPLPDMAPPEAVVEALESKWPNNALISQSQSDVIIDRAEAPVGPRWVHKQTQNGTRVWEYYVQQCSPTLLLHTTASFLDQWPERDTAWYLARRELFKTMVSQASCRYTGGE